MLSGSLRFHQTHPGSFTFFQIFSDFILNPFKFLLIFFEFLKISYIHPASLGFPQILPDSLIIIIFVQMVSGLSKSFQILSNCSYRFFIQILSDSLRFPQIPSGSLRLLQIFSRSLFSRFL